MSKKTPILAFVKEIQVACFESLTGAAQYISTTLNTSAKRVAQRMILAMNDNRPYRNVLFSRVSDNEQFSCFVNEEALLAALSARAPKEGIPIYSIDRVGLIQEHTSITQAALTFGVTSGAINQALDSVSKRSGYRTVKNRIFVSSKDAASAISSIMENRK